MLIISLNLNDLMFILQVIDRVISRLDDMKYCLFISVNAHLYLLTYFYQIYVEVD